MIISRTPLRMSFAGGGSDLPAYYRHYGGAVLSTSINQYVYITVNRKFDEHIRVSYSRTEEVDQVGKIRHPLVRESMRLLEIDGGVEITSVADIPSKGTGLGSSSSFTVGLLHALHAYSGKYASAQQLAEEACRIELERCQDPIGKQDQYAAAYGGVNFIQFNPDDTVSVEPILCQPSTMEQLRRRIMVFYTGITRSASALLKSTQTAVRQRKDKQDVMQRIVELAFIMREKLQNNTLEAMGEIFDESWRLKRELSRQISSPAIDGWYRKARRAGALGGKLLGAGAGGFLMFYVPEDKQEAVTRALRDLRRVPMDFEPQGSRIIFVHQ